MVVQSLAGAKGVGNGSRRRGQSPEEAFTLVEVMVALGIAMAVLGTLIYGYLQSYRMTDSVTFEAAAHRLTVDRLQVVQAARWTAGTNWASTDLARFNNTTIGGVPLELPLLTSNRVLATLTTAVTLFDTNLQLCRIQVQCMWTNLSGQVFTNSLVTLRGPD